MTRAEGWVRNGPTQAKRRLEWATHLLVVGEPPSHFSLNLPQASYLLGMTNLLLTGHSSRRVIPGRSGVS